MTALAMLWGGTAAALAEPTTMPATEPTTAPATMPATAPVQAPVPAVRPEDAQKTLDALLRAKPGMARPIPPSKDETVTRDKASDEGLAPDEPSVPLKHEGDVISQRVVRLQKTPKGDWELHFESDGRALQDPPIIALPCRNLMRMQDQQKTAGRNIRFIVTGMLTEYRGRNYLVIEKAQVVADDEEK